VMNPKLEGSPIVDAVPQAGKCPHNCRACYFNRGFYREPPFIPTDDEAEGKIVRVCSGNDANNNRELVIDVTKHYPNKFYCTSQPFFDFPGPVQYTCNPNEEAPPTLTGYDARHRIHSVRFRFTPWHLNYLRNAISWYCTVLQLPLILSPMRYYDLEDIPVDWRPQYTLKKHILNSYYMFNHETEMRSWPYSSRFVFVCSGLCRDCLQCVRFYQQTAMIAASRKDAYPYA
jgi:hypothetical protein